MAGAPPSRAGLSPAKRLPALLLMLLPLPMLSAVAAAAQPALNRSLPDWTGSFEDEEVVPGAQSRPPPGPLADKGEAIWPALSQWLGADAGNKYLVAGLALVVVIATLVVRLHYDARSCAPLLVYL
eukprot:COSAG01_NODE_3064_length_6647_cov_29.485186_1_plen_126_part_00